MITTYFISILCCLPCLARVYRDLSRRSTAVTPVIFQREGGPMWTLTPDWSLTMADVIGKDLFRCDWVLRQFPKIREKKKTPSQRNQFLFIKSVQHLLLLLWRRKAFLMAGDPREAPPFPFPFPPARAGISRAARASCPIPGALRRSTRCSWPPWCRRPAC